MAFITDKQELKRGLIIFRRGDLKHREWYCRIKLPATRRYKLFALQTTDVESARERAFDHFANIRFSLQNGYPIFNRPFREVAQEYLLTQQARAERGEISKGRPEKIKAIIEGPLEEYVGSTQVHLIGDELWDGYAAWRRENGEGRAERNGGRKVSPELATKFVTLDQAMREKARAARCLRPKPLSPAEFQRAVEAKLAGLVPFISDATIRFEISIFASVMQYAIKKQYSPASQRFDDRPKLKKMRRDAFTHEEYTALYTHSRDIWCKGKNKDGTKPDRAMSNVSEWYRKVAHNFLLVMCNTGMRPSEAKNLRWRDVTQGKDRDGQDIVGLFVRGKGKSRQLVALPSVGKYLDRIRQISKATKPDDPVFTTIDGTPASSLYKALIDDLLNHADLRVGPGGTIRSTYSFRHTYATMRLSEGVDVYLLAEQMGTSVAMIEDHYGHVDRMRHADRILQGGGGWHRTTIEVGEDDTGEATTKAAKAASVRDQEKRPAKPRRGRRNRAG